VGKELPDLPRDDHLILIEKILNGMDSISMIDAYITLGRGDLEIAKLVFALPLDTSANGEGIAKGYYRVTITDLVEFVCLRHRDPAFFAILKPLMNKSFPLHSDGSRRNTTVLLRTARSSNMALIKWLIDNGADLKQQDSRGQTALHVAVGNMANKPMLKWLIDNGVDLDQRDSGGKTPLHLAVQHHLSSMALEAA
jgi:hypothetical protein